MAAPETVDLDTFSFEATDVTGTSTVVAERVQRTLPAKAVAKSLAEKMALPASVPWVLRDDLTSAYLDDDKPIGEQIGPQAKVTLTPRAHLG